MKLPLLLAVILGTSLLAPPQSAAQATTIFAGVPVVKISEMGFDRIPEDMDRGRAEAFSCVISQIGDRYYWASRENKEMVRIASGAFVTFLAVDGSGYVRVIASGMKAAVSLASETEASFDYVEHLLFGLRSVTYYGVPR